jgi:hypothetical protein
MLPVRVWARSFAAVIAATVGPESFVVAGLVVLR